MTAQARLQFDPDGEAFQSFDSANPEVYRLLARFAREVKASGRKRYSIWALVNRIRWHVEIETKGSDFKLNNNLTPWYARALMEREPDLVDFFETRRMRA